MPIPIKSGRQVEALLNDWWNHHHNVNHRRGGSAQRSSRKRGGYTKDATVNVQSVSSVPLFARMFKVDEQLLSSYKSGVIGPVSDLVRVMPTGTTVIQYEKLGWRDTFTPGRTIHLYWAESPSALARDPGVNTRNYVRIYGSTNAVTIPTLQGGRDRPHRMSR